MTEASENAYLVRVRAQVMCRDEGTGGWMALGGGGLADVMVCRRGPADAEITSESASASHTEYYIHGRRISDNVLVLDCTVKDDFQYHKVMPTFHHWVSDEKRFGLTFQTAADARAFDKGVRTAVSELYRLGGAWPSMYGYKGKVKSKEDDEENNIFECLNLPTDSRSSSENSTASRVRRADELTQTPILSAITLPQHPLSESMNLQYEDKDDSEGDRCPYVHLSAVHEYTYPQVGPGGVITSEKSSPNTKPPLLKRDSGSIKKCSYSGPPPLPDKNHPASPTFQARLKCRHCHEWYLESANRAGACEYAPDCFKSCIECVSCIKCAQCMLYHCMADAEGDFAMHPCTCAPADEACAKRWLCITLLSFLVPCLWCYLPLRCVHKAARAAKIAGGVHAPHIHK
ncbi:sprouty-related, EVH1 domain-containing protein 1 [Bicyclus anynana]|uniref:Sprouty-related, EVH1 domain-containing protein 1 n=1 Tax=Bicyclus anynana TaxID=110368 RepID=A0ABM3LUZ7_BICAN|nr:sprouty-related, EVH1 domain-containing protein 1 [Bicyclus anynana]